LEHPSFFTVMTIFLFNELQLCLFFINYVEVKLTDLYNGSSRFLVQLMPLKSPHLDHSFLFRPLSHLLIDFPLLKSVLDFFLLKKKSPNLKCMFCHFSPPFLPLLF
jgi:hypothetical protein